MPRQKRLSKKFKIFYLFLTLVHYSEFNEDYGASPPDKGKPAERQGRKASGLKGCFP
jgi:hypothetical protein